MRRTLTRGEDGRGWIVGASTKSGKGRRVRLTRRAATALKDHRRRQLEERMRLAGLWQDNGLVFPNETGSLFNPSTLRNRSFKRIKARAGVREDLRFHDLRHTCATLLLGEGDRGDRPRGDGARDRGHPRTAAGRRPGGARRFEPKDPGRARLGAEEAGARSHELRRLGVDAS